MPDSVDLELSLQRGEGQAYAAEVSARRGDDVELKYGPFSLALDLEALQALYGQAEEYGEALTRGVFAQPGLWAAFAAARDTALSAGMALRVRLLVEPEAAELAGLAWELLADPESGLPLSLHERVIFSRYAPTKNPAAVSLPPLRGGLKVLAVAANPSNLSAYRLARIDAAKELGRAETWLAPLRVERLPAAAGDLVTLNRLLDRSRGVDVLFLACHAAYRRKITALYLEGEDGKVKRATGADLVQRFSQAETRPRLVVLALCESAGAGTGEALSALGPMLAEAGIPAVVAMQGPVSMETMDDFLPFLFRELARDGRIDRAVAVARRASTDHPDWWSPALFMGLLSGRLWEEEEGAGGPLLNPLAVPHEVPAPPANFIGRAAELADLIQAIEAGAAVINIHGTNGVGKTAVARELVRRVKERFPDGQANLDLQGSAGRSQVSAPQALTYIIQKFDPTIAQLPSDEVLLRGRYQSLLYDRRALILLDNVNDLEQIAPFLPPPEGCLVLITSWERFESPDVGIQNHLLGKLPPADAEALLVALAPRAVPRAAELAERCEHLPLALDGIARRLNKSPNLSLDDIFALLDDLEERLEVTGVAATLQVSYDMLGEEQKRAWRQLSVFAADFDVTAVAWVWGRVDAATAPARLRSRIIRARLDLEDLLGFGLVEHDPQKDRYQLHNLERAFAANLDDFTAEEAEAARLAHARYYHSVLLRANELYLKGSQTILDGLALFDREAREVRAAWAWLQNGAAADSAAPDLARGELLAKYPAAFANLMAVRLMPEERIQWLATARSANQKSGDLALEVVLASSLGVAYYVLDRHAEAFACQNEALQAARALAKSAGPGEGAKCSGLVRVLGNLGALYRVTRRLPRAIRYLSKQLELARRFGLRREESHALGTLGRVYLDMGDMERSIAHYQAELAIAAEDGDRRAQGIALGGLADVYRVLKNFDRAREYLEQDIAIMGEIGDRRGQAIASWMLGKVYNDQGNLAQAVANMQVLVDYEKEIGHQDAHWHAEKVADLLARMRGE